MLPQLRPQDMRARIHARVKLARMKMAFIQRRSGTGASLHAGRPSNDDIINRARHAYRLRHYRQTRQIELTNLELPQIELYLHGKICCRPTMQLVFQLNLDLKDITQLYMEAKVPYRYDESIEQQRWDEILQEVVVRRMTVKEHDAIIQRPARSETSIEQRRWDRTVYEEWLRNLTLKEHDRFVQGLLKVPAHITRPGVHSIEPEVTTIYAEDA